ncbi:hypothetical protein [Faecalibacterium sp. An77]|nr:hypothetical protein [Faecalibacterium sp. An77]
MIDEAKKTLSMQKITLNLLLTLMGEIPTIGSQNILTKHAKRSG